MRVAFHTFGCKVNQYDSESLAHLLRERGHQVVESVDDAEVVVINTCTVTKESERKARQWLRNTEASHPGIVLAVTGCYAQTNPRELMGLPGVRFVSGVKDRESLVEWLEESIHQKEAHFTVKDWSEQEALNWYEADFPFRTRAYLKIEDGCSSNCSYCKIPSARGPVRSLPPDQVTQAFQKLLAMGNPEVVLTGIHLGCYGMDLGTGLDEVVQSVDALPGNYRFRLGSVEPTDFTPNLILAIASAHHLCPHLHIPLQSGSDAVLARMNRKYTTHEYLRLIQVLRQQIPGLAITTDVILGFPGETEEEFWETFEFVANLSLSGLHVFPFSRREGTPAYTMPNPVSRQAKQERVRKLIRLGEDQHKAFAQQMVGQKVNILVETMEPGIGEGFSEHYLRGRVHGVEEPGEIVEAVVRSVDNEGNLEAYIEK